MEWNGIITVTVTARRPREREREEKLTCPLPRQPRKPRGRPTAGKVERVQTLTTLRPQAAASRQSAIAAAAFLSARAAPALLLLP